MTAKNYQHEFSQDEFLLKHLKNQFRFATFKNGQKEIIRAILDGKDALALFPTGSGKSLCYQFPASLLPSYTVVILPLIALMQDQLRSIQKFGIKGALISNEIAPHDEMTILKNLNEIKVLFISPERIQQRFFLEVLKKSPPSLFVIDEAHAISIWGRSFRPSYLELHLIKEQFSDIPILAMTATATAFQEKEIIRALQLNTPFILRGNLLSESQKLIVKKREPYFLDHVFLKSGPGIIFTETKEEAEKIYSLAKEKGLISFIYHSSLSKEIKEENLNSFLNQKNGFMIATLALGLGIDKPDIRFIVHAAMPDSLSRYLQEIGRGGRDGKGVEVTLYYDLKDYKRLKYLAEKEHDGIVLETTLNEIKSTYSYCKTEECRALFLYRIFQNDVKLAKCERCDNCTRKKSFWKRFFF